LVLTSGTPGLAGEKESREIERGAGRETGG
jgi:hypothetical protein